MTTMSQAYSMQASSCVVDQVLSSPTGSDYNNVENINSMYKIEKTESNHSNHDEQTKENDGDNKFYGHDNLVLQQQLYNPALIQRSEQQKRKKRRKRKRKRKQTRIVKAKAKPWALTRGLAAHRRRSEASRNPPRPHRWSIPRSCQWPRPCISLNLRQGWCDAESSTLMVSLQGCVT